MLRRSWIGALFGSLALPFVGKAKATPTDEADMRPYYIAAKPDGTFFEIRIPRDAIGATHHTYVDPIYPKGVHVRAEVSFFLKTK